MTKLHGRRIDIAGVTLLRPCPWREICGGLGYSGVKPTDGADPDDGAETAACSSDSVSKGGPCVRDKGLLRGLEFAKDGAGMVGWPARFETAAVVPRVY